MSVATEVLFESLVNPWVNTDPRGKGLRHAVRFSAHEPVGQEPPVKREGML